MKIRIVSPEFLNLDRLPCPSVDFGYGFDGPEPAVFARRRVHRVHRSDKIIILALRGFVVAEFIDRFEVA